MKILISLLISFFLINTSELSEIRNTYYLASKSKENAELFYDLLSKNKSEKAIFLGYKGASCVLKSKYLVDRKLKKQLFIDGLKTIELAIKNEPNNIEIRLIRLSIQENVPKITKYKANITEDKNMLYTMFEKQDKSLREFIKIYSKQSNVFSENEKQFFNK